MKIEDWVKSRNEAVGVAVEKNEKMQITIESVVAKLDDREASKFSELLARRKEDGSLIRSGTYITENGDVYRASVDLWDTPENSPATAPTLWEKVQYRDGYRILGDTISATNPVSSGEICWVGDVKWKSKANNNVWLPKDYPAYWERVE